MEEDEDSDVPALVSVLSLGQGSSMLPSNFTSPSSPLIHEKACSSEALYISRAHFGQQGLRNQQERDTFARFQRRVEHFMLKRTTSTFELDDSMLMRFLVAANFKEEKSLHGLQKHLEWSDLFRPSSITPKDLPKTFSSGALKILGQTAAGFNVLYFRVAEVDQRFGDDDEAVRYVAYFMEESIRLMDRRRATQQLIVCDLEGLRFSAKGQVHRIRTIIDTLQNNYPERLAKMLLVNFPVVFKFLWRLVEKFIDCETRKKIEFSTKAKLQEYIPPNLLAVQVV